MRGLEGIMAEHYSGNPTERNHGPDREGSNDLGLS